ncbi:hypothetical protein MK280_03035, partial [Myxococcota bacterium]|nr:hypothetical protein [Myxococcota bacterium]
ESVVVGSEAPVSNECEETIQRHIAAEAIARQELLQFLHDRDVHVVDPLTKMQEAADQERLYRLSADSHPIDRGYELMAEALVEANLDGRRR